MALKLIAESGATKVDWRTVGASSGRELSFRTDGINAATMTPECVRERLHEASFMLRSSLDEKVGELHFFGAGLVKGPLSDSVRQMLEEEFPQARVECESDLAAAARALFGRSPGIAVILGTGANSCLYDGRGIVDSVPAGGFILGDEGSAAVLGKNLLSDYLRGLIPQELAERLEAAHELGYPKIVAEVYRGSSPSAYLASFAPFVTENKDSPYCRGLLRNNLRAFVDRVLGHYDFRNYPVGVVGSFGLACRDVLEEIGDERGIRFERFVARPLDELVEFYR